MITLNDGDKLKRDRFAEAVQSNRMRGGKPWRSGNGRIFEARIRKYQETAHE